MMRSLCAAFVFATGIAAAQQFVTFPADDGGIVEADLYGTSSRAVLLAHGGRFKKESWAPQAQSLTAHGFRVLAINHRGGESGRNAVIAAARFLRDRRANTIYAIGGSMGGTSIAEAASEAKPVEIARIVLLASGVIANPERMRGRKLFAICRDDPGPGDIPRLPAFRAQFEKATQPKELIVLECAEHAQFIFASPHGTSLWSEILRFVDAL